MLRRGTFNEPEKNCNSYHILMDFHGRPPTCVRGELDFTPRRRHRQGGRRLDNPLKTSGPAVGTWSEVRADVVGDRPIGDSGAFFRLTAPYRAEDAATLPTRIVQTDDARRTKVLTLVINENPAPVAAILTLRAAIRRVNPKTRMRIVQYFNVRAIAENADGVLWMVGRYAKACRGCRRKSWPQT